jgi:uncharacterized membrane protein
MSQFVVAVFPTLASAKQAEAALYELGEKEANIFGSAVVLKEPDGGIQVLDLVPDSSHSALVASLLGGIVGAATAGPLAGAVGAASGALAGMAVDLHGHTTGQMLIKKVATSLRPNNAAIIVDIEFELVALFEEQMKKLGAVRIWRN